MVRAQRYVPGMARPKTADYFVSTPYVDAYTRREGTRAEFEERLLDQSMHWGEQGLGAALLKGEPAPETYEDGVYVLAIGRFDETKYAAVQKAGTDDVEVVEFDWPYDWDVT